MTSTSSNPPTDRRRKAGPNAHTRRRRRPGRSRQMTATDVDSVLQLLEAWPLDRRHGKLTWNRLIAVIATKGTSWTRQTLFAKPEIAKAFTEAKRQLKGEAELADQSASIPAADPAVDLLRRRIAALEEEIQRLNTTLRNYDERFVRYQHNAQRHGISVAELTQPLPPAPGGPDRANGSRRARAS
jgi:hypothetical protein